MALRTIRNFEIALGRCALWAPRRWRDEAGELREEYVGQLRIYPHALREANAYYSPERKALLFGYFQASPTDPTAYLPGGTVFTCLSHDVVAHETAHALLDGMHRRLTEPSNPDVLAFHEAFASVIVIMLGQPSAPCRGAACLVDRAIIGVSALLMLFLLFFVVDAVRLCVCWITMLRDSAWTGTATSIRTSPTYRTLTGRAGCAST